MMNMASTRVMNEKNICTVLVTILIMTVTLTSSVFAAFSTASGYSSTELHSTAGTFTTIGGLDLDAGSLYFGNYTEIKSLDLSDNSVTTEGTVPSNAGNTLVVRSAGVTYTAFGTSYNSPYPHKMGYIDGGGIYVNQLDEDGIYDAAVNSSGDCYLIANPGALGSKIFKYDFSTGATLEIADIGGYSGGLAFDIDDNLYYADQGDDGRDASILKFTSAQLAAGGLVADDGDSVLDLAAGYIGLDDDGDFYATRYLPDFTVAFSKYDLLTGLKIEDIAFGGIGQFVFNGDTIYAIDTDWGAYASTIQQIVPEPATITLLGLAGLWLRRRRA